MISEKEKWKERRREEKLFPDRCTDALSMHKGTGADGREENKGRWIWMDLERRGGVCDARRIMALVKGKIALTFMWDLAESISPVFLENWSSRYWLPPVRKERAWLHRHQPNSISVTRLLDRCHRSTEVSPFA